MRIGFEAKRFFHNFTGLGNYSRFVVKALAERYPDVALQLYTPGYEKGKAAVDAIVDRPSVEVKTPEGWSKLLKRYWRSYQTGNIAREEGVAVFHGLSNELPFSVKGQPYKKVVTIHDLLFLRYPEYFHPINRGIYNRKFRFACEAADTIVAVSKQTAADITEFYGVPEEKVRVVYQGCHPNFMQELPEEALLRVKRHYRLPDEYLLYVGTVEPRKNALLILQALRMKNSTIPLVIVGQPTPYKKVLLRYIRQHRLQDRVLFLENCAFQDLPVVYRMASLFIYPSFFEGFGIPIVEALASGVPVITSKGGCFSEAGGPESIYIDPHDPEALSAAISRVLTDTALRKTMITAGAAHLQQFAPEKVAGDLMAVYRG